MLSHLCQTCLNVPSLGIWLGDDLFVTIVFSIACPSFQSNHKDASCCPEAITMLSLWASPVTRSPLPAHSLHEASTCYKHPDFGAHADCIAPIWKSLCCFAWIARTQAPGLGGGIKERTAFSSDLALAHYANGNPGRSSSQGPILHTQGCVWKLEATRFLFEYISSLRTKARDEKLLESFVRMGMPSDKLGHMSYLDAGLCSRLSQ